MNINGTEDRVYVILYEMVAGIADAVAQLCGYSTLKHLRLTLRRPPDTDFTQPERKIVTNCIQVILMGINEHKYNEEIVIGGLELLESLTRGIDTTDIIEKCDIEVVFEAIRIHEAVAGIQTIGFTLLRWWLPDVHDVDMQLDLLQMVMAAMRVHAENVMVLQYAFWILFLQATHPPNIDLIVYSGCVKLVLDAMVSHTECFRTQKNAIYVISMLCKKNHNGVILVRMGCIERVLIAMENFTENCYMQTVCSELLYHITGGYNAFVDIIPEINTSITCHGGIDLVLAAMRTFSEDPLIQEYGCYTLRNLAREYNSTREIIAKDGAVVAVKALEIHSQFRERKRIVSACFEVLDEIARVGDTNVVVKNGGVRAVISAMWVHASNQEIQEIGCGLLHRMAMDDVLGVDVMREGCQNVLISALSRYPHNDYIQNCVIDVTVQYDDDVMDILMEEESG